MIKVFYLYYNSVFSNYVSRLLALLFFLMGMIICTAATPVNVDSLQESVRSLDGKAKLPGLLRLAKTYLGKDNQKAEKYVHNAIVIANKLDDLSGQAQANLLMAHIKAQENDANQTLSFAYKALNFYKKMDTIKGIIDIHQFIGDFLGKDGSYEKAKEHLSKAVEFAKKQDNKEELGSCYSKMGLLYVYKGDYLEASKHFKKFLTVSKETGDSSSIATAYNNLGVIYKNQGNYPKALNYHLNALKMREAIEDSGGVAMSYNNIGIVHKYLANYEKALDFQFQSIAIKKKRSDSTGLARSYNNIGNIYKHMGDYEEALKYQKKSLNISKHLGEERRYASSYNNIAEIHYEMQEFKKALDYNFKSLQINRKFEDMNGLAVSHLNIGKVYAAMDQYENALVHLENGRTLAKRIGDRNKLLEIYHILASLYAKMNNYKRAFKNHRSYAQLKDTLFNATKSKQLAQMEQKYKNEKQEKEIKLLKKEKQIQQAKLKQKTILQNALTIGIIFILVLGAVIYYAYRQKIRANHTLEKQKRAIEHHNKHLQEANEAINHQKKVIETKNKDITDSINYAKRIQQAILPDPATLNDYCRESFVLFKPRDIVSGDFYWLNPVLNGSKSKGNSLMVAAVDCTGHGVPGAFMSMIANELLNKLALEDKLRHPKKILQRLDRGVVQALRQRKGSDTETSDGMDMAFCKIDWGKQQVQFAGAMNPLYVVRNGKLIEWKGTPASIGGNEVMDKQFQEHSFKYREGDMLYLFSDGYHDQFGGPSGKKFMRQRFKELLVSAAQHPMSKQREILEKTFYDWKGDEFQVDDVLVIGLKV